MSAFVPFVLLGAVWFTMFAFVLVLCRAVGQMAARDVVAADAADYPSRLDAELESIARAVDVGLAPGPQAGRSPGAVESTLAPGPHFRSAH